MESGPMRVDARKLIEIATRGETDAERAEAKKRLRDLAAAWRGFPGKRRRGEPPPGVFVR